jgi:hypothetical protein
MSLKRKRESEEEGKEKKEKKNKFNSYRFPDQKSLQIIKIDAPTEVDLPFETHGVLPKPPFRMELIAPPHSGKTTLLLNMLLSPTMGYNKYFKKIVVWSPTLLEDPTWSALPDEILKDSYDKFDMNTILNEWEEAKDDVKQNGKTLDNARWFIIDDSMGELFAPGNMSTPATDVCTRGRHDNVSVSYVTQAYKKLPKSVRIGASNVAMWNCPNEQEVLDVFKEHGGDMNKEDFLAMCHHVWKTPYAFLHLNYQFSPPKFFSSFGNEVMLKDAGEKEEETNEGDEVSSAKSEKDVEDK